MKSQPRSFSFGAMIGRLTAWIIATSLLAALFWAMWWQRDTVLLVARGETSVDQLIQDRWESITGTGDPKHSVPRPERRRQRAKPTQADAGLLSAKEIRKWRGRFKPLERGPDRTAAHWCPSNGESIEYRIDATIAKTFGISFKQERRAWRAAFDEWTRASGGRYTFQYAGKASFPIAHVLSGSGILETRVEPGSIAITYAVPGKSGADYEHPDFHKVLGMGGIYSPIGAEMRIQRASILVDVGDLVLLDTETRARLRAHEIGHALGLRHVKHFDALMRPGQLGPSSPQPGDIAGIQSLAKICNRSADKPGA